MSNTDVLFVTAEEVYQEYDRAKVIDAKLLYAWLVAEKLYAESIGASLILKFGRLPVSDKEKRLWHAFGMAYRDCRREGHREVLVAKPDQVFILDPDI